MLDVYLNNKNPLFSSFTNLFRSGSVLFLVQVWKKKTKRPHIHKRPSLKSISNVILVVLEGLFDEKVTNI